MESRPGHAHLQFNLHKLSFTLMMCLLRIEIRFIVDFIRSFSLNDNRFHGPTIYYLEMMMADKLTIELMRQLIKRLEELKNLDEEIPQSYVDRLERSVLLLRELKSLSPVNWAELSGAEDIEKAEMLIHQKLELMNEIEKHFNTCALTTKSRGRERVVRQRQPKRSKEQMEFDNRVEQITKSKRKELGLPFGRGVRLSLDDRKKLEDAVQKELKKLKIVSPRS
jgi:hypothetical protein